MLPGALNALDLAAHLNQKARWLYEQGALAVRQSQAMQPDALQLIPGLSGLAICHGRWMLPPHRPDPPGSRKGI